MGHENIDVENLQVTGTKPSGAGAEALRIDDDVTVIVSQAFGPGGDSLMGIEGAAFDGFPAVCLLVRAGGREEVVQLSPIHGDGRKRGLDGLADGTKCELLCPVTKKPLDKIGKVFDDSDAEYFAVYLTKKLDKGSTIYVSDVWGHHHSRIVDNNELISYWAASGSDD